MNRYLLLTSAHRDRNTDPNPFEFTAGYNSVPTNKRTALDWVSDQAPVLNIDLYDYFVDTTATTAPYQWYQTGVIVAPSSTSNRTIFTVTIDARGNGSAPAPVDDQYVGLTFLYNNGTIVYSEIITRFVAVSATQYEMTIANAIDVVNVAPNADFRILSPQLNLNQFYVPTPALPILVDNAYTGYYATEIVQNTTSQILAFDATSQVVTATSNWNFVSDPRHFVIAKGNATLIYEVQTVNTVTNTVTLNVSDHPSNPSPDFASQYMYQYSDAFSAHILTCTTVAGVISLTFASSVNLSSVNVGDLIGILLFSADNKAAFDYQGSMRDTQWQDRSQVRIYGIALLSLQMPNVLLTGSPGGYPITYPYVEVTLENLSSEQRNDQVIYSNNPSITKATFVCPIMDISTPAFSPFTKVDSCGLIFPFNIKANDSVRLTVRAPSGDVLQCAQSDTFSPTLPNPMLQVSALFAILPQGTSNEVCKY
jgi:hypothetical protein